MNVIKQLDIVHFLGFYKQLKVKCKITCVNKDKEFLEYVTLNKKEIQYRVIEKF